MKDFTEVYALDSETIAIHCFRDHQHRGSFHVTGEVVIQPTGSILNCGMWKIQMSKEAT